MPPKNKNAEEEEDEDVKFNSLGEARSGLQKFINDDSEEVDHIDEDGNEILKGDIFNPDDPDDKNIVSKFSDKHGWNEEQTTAATESLWGKGGSPLVSSSDGARTIEAARDSELAPAKRQSNLLANIAREGEARQRNFDRPSKIGRWQELQDEQFGVGHSRGLIASNKTKFKRAVREAKRMGVNPSDPAMLKMLMGEEGIDDPRKRATRGKISDHVREQKNKNLNTSRRGVHNDPVNNGATAFDDSDPNTKAGDIAWLFDEEDEENRADESNIVKAGSPKSKIRKAGSPESSIRQSPRNRKR